MKEENGTVEKSNADDKQKRKRLETTQGETGRNKEKRVNQKKCTHSGYDKNFVGLHFLEWDGFGMVCCVFASWVFGQQYRLVRSDSYAYRSHAYL